MSRDRSEPLTPLGEAAAGLHEGYLALRAGGFTRFEALYIVARLVRLGVEDDDTDSALPNDGGEGS